jgi:transcriptional regulator
MYIPDAFALTGRDEILAVLRDYAFAVLVTAVDGAPPQATHLPFMIDAAAGINGTLFAHMARANPHWRDLARLQKDGGEALIVFQGPHAYVSPRWYAAGVAVPTWNYVAVHAYGTPRLIEDAAETWARIDELVATHEAGAAAPWRLDQQDDSYIATMLRGIVAFEIPIARLEAKAKLSQNKRAEDRRGVIAALGAGDDPLARDVAALMQRREPATE